MDSALANLPRTVVIALAAVSLALVGIADYLTGYEISFSVFYLAPVGIAAWYADRRAGVLLAIGSSVVWYVAEMGVGHPYHHPAIPVWNAFVRLSFFLIVALLLSTLRGRLHAEQRLARIDALTGLPNSRAFVEQLIHDLACAGRASKPLTLVYLDVDDFKTVNDGYGHSEGDRVLRGIGRTLIEATRRSDTVARLGGDEFALLLPATDLSGAEIFIGKLRQAFRDHSGRAAGRVTCSIGAVEFREQLLSAEEAIAVADRVMYEAKSRGKNTAVFRRYVRPTAETLRPDPPLAA